MGRKALVPTEDLLRLWLEGYTTADIASQVGMDLKAVQARLANARRGESRDE